MVKAQIDLMQFCGYRFDQPQNWGEYTYATNEAICVRVVRVGEYLLNENVATVMDSLLGMRAVKWSKMPRLKECMACGNTGLKNGDRCDEPRCGIMFGSCKIARRYANIIKSLPGVLWSEHRTKDAIVFKFDGGGKGIVMRLKQEDGTDD